MDGCKGYEAAGPILPASMVGCPAGPGLTSELTSDLDPGSWRAADRGGAGSYWRSRPCHCRILGKSYLLKACNEDSLDIMGSKPPSSYSRAYL